MPSGRRVIIEPGTPMARLFVYPKKGETYWFDLRKDKTTLGRSADNDIPLLDPFSSGHHAAIVCARGGFLIRDIGSKNGTFLNGKKVARDVELKRGDEILVGSTRVIFDKEVSSNVEVTESAAPSRNINTIIHLNDILKKPDIETTIEGLSTAADFVRIKSDLKSMAVLNEVSQALLLHQPETELLEHIMDLISALSADGPRRPDAQGGQPAPAHSQGHPDQQPQPARARRSRSAGASSPWSSTSTRRS